MSKNVVYYHIGVNDLETKLTSIIGGIKEKTGIDITIFDMLGEKVAATSSIYSHVFVDPAKFKDNFYADPGSGLSYFLFSTPFNMYVGVISGIDAAAANYAYMIASMIESGVLRMEDNLSRNDSIKQILLGEASHSKISKITRKFSSLNQPCYVLSIVCSHEKVDDVLNFLDQLSGDGDDTAVLTDDDMIAYIKVINGDSDYQSALDFAEMLSQNIEQELHIRVYIGVGSFAKTAFELAGAYLQGSSAVRMGVTSSDKSSIFSYKEFIMVRMIEDIPKPVLTKYLEILLDTGAKDILKDPDMLNTAEEFLANSLNISETARHLFMHRNTLMYRLDKIEKSMGLNIRRFSDAVTFRIILILYKHLNY